PDQEPAPRGAAPAGCRLPHLDVERTARDRGRYAAATAGGWPVGCAGGLRRAWRSRDLPPRPQPAWRPDRIRGRGPQDAMSAAASSGFADHFSAHAAQYAVYRPKYPAALFQ